MKKTAAKNMFLTPNDMNGYTVTVDGVYIGTVTRIYARWGFRHRSDSTFAKCVARYRTRNDALQGLLAKAKFPKCHSCGNRIVGEYLQDPLPRHIGCT